MNSAGTALSTIDSGYMSTEARSSSPLHFYNILKIKQYSFMAFFSHYALHHGNLGCISYRNLMISMWAKRRWKNLCIYHESDIVNMRPGSLKASGWTRGIPGITKPCVYYTEDNGACYFS